MRIIITSPSLNTNHNVSGISSVTNFIISSNPDNEYIHFIIGRKDNEKRNLSWFLRILGVYIKWLHLMVTQRAVLIHFNLALSEDSIIRDSPLIILARLFCKRMIIHIHGGDFLMHKKKPLWMTRLLKIVLSGKNPIVVLSPIEKEVLQESNNCKNIYVLPNCIALNEANDFDRIYSDSEPLKLLFLGRISVEKGIDYIYLAMESLKAKGIKFMFFMAGKGPEEINYNQKFENLLGKDFEFKGVVSGVQKSDLLKKCDVFLLPSFFEGLPMALLESMSFGLVPVVTNVGSIKYVVNDGINGMMVNSHSSEDIAFAIEKLSKEKEHLRELSKNARQYIFSNFKPEVYISRLNEIYDYE
jgi:glycosyltransferase involved in cell wall biosynthesis